ncbi:hypothetical protein WJR50_18950 [Catalinimonas sp. 4WD22]|uniref:hypothetical protein n=1 Tax=Catalinimonas locisalis TaxID=3133978 RepID=UPI0031018051
MKKYESIAQNFEFFYDSVYVDSGISQVLAARLLTNHLLHLNRQEAEHFLKIFFTLHSDHFKVYNIVFDRKDSVRRFIQMIAESFPVLSNHINGKVYDYICNISDQDIQDIIQYADENKIMERFYSFSEVVNNPDNQISLNTLKNYIKKLNIDVKNVGNEKAKGKFITESDLQKILEAKNG